MHVRMKTRNPAYRALFSMACLAITVQAAGYVYGAARRAVGPMGRRWRTDSQPARRRGHGLFRLQHLLIAIAIGLSTNQSVLKVWEDNFLWSAPSYFVGAGVAVAAQVGGPAVRHLDRAAAVRAAVPDLSHLQGLRRPNRRRTRHVQEMADLHLATIEALALAIDAKEQTAQSHIRRVQVYAAGLAQSLGMPDSEIQGVKTAALLHDIGKLAVPEHILPSPDR